MDKYNNVVLDNLAKYRSEIRQLALKQIKNEITEMEYDNQIKEILKRMDVVIETLQQQ